MKRAFLLLTAIIFAASCMKKSTNNTKDYFCVRHDSLYSNIPALNNPHYKDSSGYYNNYSDAQIAFFIMQQTKFDTLFFRHDTVEIEFWTINCDAVE